jgi:hypothetical protein
MIKTMTQITLQMLKDMKPGVIFASGEMMYEGKNRWIAVRGNIHDWAIYYSYPFKTDVEIHNWGSKLHDLAKVKELVNCDDEALAMYRH